jgi:hypothetical protein
VIISAKVQKKAVQNKHKKSCAIHMAQLFTKDEIFNYFNS